jgi:hypothetical protein
MHMVDGLITGKPKLLEVYDKGCLELYQEIVPYALQAEELCLEGERLGLDFPGVYDYEVCCEFGEWYGNYILNSGGSPDSTEAVEKLQELDSAFWKQ